MARDITIRYVGDSRSAELAAARVAKANQGLADGFRRVSDSASKNLRNIGASLSSAGRSLTMGFTVPFAAGFVVATKAAEESQRVTKDTAAVIKSMGGIANVTAQQVADLSRRISRKTGVDDEAIQVGQNLLLTFANIRNEVGKGNDMFNRASQVTVDLAARFKTDIPSAAKLVGKALNDPIGGLTSLRRVGVQFTEQQREQIRTLVESGDVLGAQRVIMAELGRETAGSAAAQATATDKLKVAFDELAERVGEKLLPFVERFANWLTNKAIPAIEGLLGWFSRLNPTIQKFALIGIGLIAVLGPLLIMLGAVATAIGAIGAPVILVVAAIAALVAGVIYAYKNFEGFRNVVDGVVNWFRETAIPAFVRAGEVIRERFQVVADWWKETWPQISEAVSHALNVIRGAIEVFVSVVTTLWRIFGDAILAYAEMIWNNIYTVISSVLGTIRGVINFFLAVINGDWGKAWQAIKDILAAQWELIKGVVQNGLTFLKTILLMAWGAVKRAASAAWEGVRKGISTVWDGIKSTVRAGANFVIGIINGLISGVNWVLRKLKIPEIPKVPTIGAPRSGSGAASQGGRAAGSRPTGAAAGARIGAGFMTNGPQVIVGEGNRAFPEFVIPTDPKYRARALGLFSQLAGHMMPGMALGGILGGIGDAFKGGLNFAKGVVGGLAGTVLRKVLETGYRPFNAAAKAALSRAPNPFGIRDIVDGLRETVWQWVRGADSAMPEQGPTGVGVGGGALSGLEDRFEKIVRRILSLGGGAVSLVSGFRSRASQARLYADYIAGVPGQALAARPGTSKHERGLAVDWGGNRSLYTRLSHQFGLVAPVPGEPWHWQPTWAGQSRSYYAHGGTIPAFKNGGVLERTGLYFGHAGETVLPRAAGGAVLGSAEWWRQRAMGIGVPKRRPGVIFEDEAGWNPLTMGNRRGTMRRAPQVVIQNLNIHANTEAEGRAAGKGFIDVLARRHVLTDARIT